MKQLTWLKIIRSGDWCLRLALREWVSRFLMWSALLGYTLPFTLVQNTDDKEPKHNPEKANNTKHSKTKLSWFSRFIRHSARKRGGLMLQYFWAHTGLALRTPGNARQKRTRSESLPICAASVGPEYQLPRGCSAGGDDDRLSPTRPLHGTNDMSVSLNPAWRRNVRSFCMMSS